jgi:ABC-2 type transport system ATP-binding protein
MRGVTKRFRPPPAPWRRLLGLPVQPDTVALCDVSLQVQPGEILGLVGPNGAGKTVLVKLIATLTEPTSGQLHVFGLDSVRAARTIRSGIGLATADERSFYWRLTCRQNLMFFARLYGRHGAAARRLVDELLDTIDLSDAADRPYRVLSAGNRQRLAIARALLPDPMLLLLDEPTSSLDPIAAANLRKLVVERLHRPGERSVLFTSHDLREVEEICTRVAVLSGGRILACSDPSSLVSSLRATDLGAAFEQLMNQERRDAGGDA